MHYRKTIVDDLQPAKAILVRANVPHNLNGSSKPQIFCFKLEILYSFQQIFFDKE